MTKFDRATFKKRLSDLIDKESLKQRYRLFETLIKVLIYLYEPF